MPGMRSQGRPIRDAAVGGKEAVLHGVRDFLRSNTDLDFSRKSIAKFLNVTPALVSYYFPDRNDLLINATVPILKTIVENIEYIFSSEEDNIIILKTIILFYVNCHINDGGIIKCFSEFVVKSENYNGPDYILAIRNKTRDFINLEFSNHRELSIKLRSISWNIWSLCQLLITEGPGASASARPVDPADPSAAQYADRIFNLLTDGVGMDRLPTYSAQSHANRASTPLTPALQMMKPNDRSDGSRK